MRGGLQRQHVGGDVVHVVRRELMVAEPRHLSRTGAHRIGDFIDRCFVEIGRPIGLAERSAVAADGVALLAIDLIELLTALQIAPRDHGRNTGTAGNDGREIRFQRANLRERQALPCTLVAMRFFHPRHGGRHAARLEVEIDAGKAHTAQRRSVGRAAEVRGVARRAGARIELRAGRRRRYKRRCQQQRRERDQHGVIPAAALLRNRRPHCARASRRRRAASRLRRYAAASRARSSPRAVPRSPAR
jgi:hypothetical protein